jgi:hypothetical protein
MKDQSEREMIKSETQVESKDVETNESQVLVDIEDLREVTGGAPKYCDTIMCAY